MSTGSGLSADAQAMMAFESSKKSAGVAFVLWFFTGGVGGHRFYLGRIGSAVTQLLMALFGWVTLVAGIGLITLVPLAIWLLVDVFLISGMVQEHNAAIMQRLNAAAAPRGAPVEELAKFAALREQGAITDKEYQIQKDRLLGPGPTPAASEVAPLQSPESLPGT